MNFECTQSVAKVATRKDFKKRTGTMEKLDPSLLQSRGGSFSIALKLLKNCITRSFAIYNVLVYLDFKIQIALS